MWGLKFLHLRLDFGINTFICANSRQLPLLHLFHASRTFRNVVCELLGGRDVFPVDRWTTAVRHRRQAHLRGLYLPRLHRHLVSRVPADSLPRLPSLQRADDHRILGKLPFTGSFQEGPITRMIVCVWQYHPGCPTLVYVCVPTRLRVFVWVYLRAWRGLLRLTAGDASATGSVCSETWIRFWPFWCRPTDPRRGRPGHNPLQTRPITLAPMWSRSLLLESWLCVNKSVCVFAEWMKCTLLHCMLNN